MDYSTIYVLGGVGSMLTITGWMVEDGWPATLLGVVLLAGAGFGWLAA